MVMRAWSREELGMDMYVQDVAGGDRKTGLDSGTASRIREITPPAIEWDRDYGSGRPLWQDGEDLLLQGYTPDEAARELVWRYDRQCLCTGEQLITAIMTRGGDTMAQTDWRTPGRYGDEHETRALWEIAAEQREAQRTWQEIADYLEEHCGVEVHFATVSSQVRKYAAAAAADGCPSPQPPPPAAANDAAEAGEGEDGERRTAQAGAGAGLSNGDGGEEGGGTATAPHLDLMAMSGEELIVGLVVQAVETLIERYEQPEVDDQNDQCRLEIEVPGVSVRISGDGPVEYMQRVMQVGSQLTLARQIAIPAIRDDDLGRLDAMEDALEERRGI